MRGLPDTNHMRHDGLQQSGVGEGTMVRDVRPLVPSCDTLTTLATEMLRTMMTGQ